MIHGSQGFIDKAPTHRGIINFGCSAKGFGGFGLYKWGPAHTFHPGCDYDFCIPAGDLPGSVHNGLEAGTTETVDRIATHRYG